jgi:CRP/FNR family transcriptional regulator
MVKNRNHLNINCNTCPVANLCISHTLNPEEKEKINSLINNLFTVDLGEHLYYQNQKMQYMFVLYSGFCKEYTVDTEGNEKINNFYFPGDMLGLESLSEKKYPFSTRALESSQFCAIPCEEILSLMHKSPRIFEQFIYIVSQKLKNNRQIPHTTNAKHRIAAFLLDIFYRLQEREKTKTHIDLAISQFDIGNFVGLAHETVNRTLHTFQAKKIIKIQNKKIYITNMQTLKTIAHWSENNVASRTPIH